MKKSESILEKFVKFFENPDRIKFRELIKNNTGEYPQIEFKENWIEIPNDNEQLTDEVILNAFKFMTQFYNSPIQNPVGKDYYNKMIENGWKYLSPHLRDLEEIKRVVSIWYKH